jgi:hypothetical protein
MRAVGAVLLGIAVVVLVTAVLLRGASWLGTRLRLPVNVPDRTWRRLARQQPVRRFSILVGVALFYLTLQVSWMPWKAQQRVALLTTVAALVVFEMVLGPARNPYTMHRPRYRRAERPGRVARALADQNLAGAIVAASARPARGFRRERSKSAVCGARTASGGTCRQPVRAAGMRCHLHVA